MEGSRRLQAMLSARCCDLRRVDFRAWLAALLARWRRQPVFRQRVRIRRLRGAHPELRVLERRCRRARRAWTQDPLHARSHELEQEIGNLDKALAGLAGAAEAATGEQRERLLQKREVFAERRRDLGDQLEGLARASASLQEWLRRCEDLQALREETGLEEAERRLRELLQQSGRASGRSGQGFEERAMDLTRRLARREGVRVLTGVTLGTARAEFDQVVLRLGRPVEVLAVVEVKRSVDDLAHGFRQRQQDLAWLTGDRGAYDPADWRTRHFPTGHFDRPAVHRQDGEEFVFERASFRRFRRDPGSGLFLRRLWFVTRPGWMRGLSSASLARVAQRLAGDPHWSPRDPDYMRGLRDWCRSLAGEMETPDVLRLYASRPQVARQILLVR